jgi:hypothetical protein
MLAMKQYAQTQLDHGELLMIRFLTGILRDAFSSRALEEAKRLKTFSFRRFFLKLGIIAISAVALAAMTRRAVDGSAIDQSSKTAPCTAAEYRQFDFWLGDWDAFENNSGDPVARTRVERLLDGCVLREDHQQTDGLNGQSFNIYDASRKIWHQSWVTNRGQLLVLEGKMEGDEMVLIGVEQAEGKHTLVRGTWKPVNGGVREIGVTSTDGGKSWKPWFDLTFRPHKP